MLVNSQLVCLRPAGILNPLTNRPQFPMVYTLINQRNGVIKCSKLKWNHEPLASGFNAKFWTFYGVISIVYKSVDHGKLWSIFFFFCTVTFIFNSLRRRPPSNCAKRRFSLLFFVFCSLFGASSTNSLSEISPHVLKFGSSLSTLRSKIIFTKKLHCVTCYVISMVLYCHRP